MADETAHVAASRRARLTFEKLAMWLIIGVLVVILALCFIALIPENWAKALGDRITAMRDDIVYFIGLITANLGISFARGSVSETVNPTNPPGGQ